VAQVAALGDAERMETLQAHIWDLLQIFALLAIGYEVRSLRDDLRGVDSTIRTFPQFEAGVEQRRAQRERGGP